MSAESFHHRVEEAMKKMKNVNDFQSFVQCVNKDGTAVEMKPSDFYDYHKYLSTAKDTEYPHLRDIAEVQFRRGSTKMFWKISFNDADYKSGEFLQKKFRIRIEIGKGDPNKKRQEGCKRRKKVQYCKT